MKQHLPLLSSLLLLFGTLSLSAQTIVERHGQLRVDGNRIVDACDRPTQLKGMSYFWSQWENTGIYNASSVKWLRDDWKVELVRAAVGVNGGDGIDYISRPAENLARATAVLDGAVQHGVYGIADFHAHYADRHLAAAKTFFGTISQRYGNTPNIIYEIWNEPIGENSDAGARRTWVDIKAYAREVISVIRDNDPDGIIVVGTPFYSQYVDIATADPLTADSKGRPVGNVAYTLHFYAGTHTQFLRDKGNTALASGHALMVTESGRTDASGSGGVTPAEWDRWEAWMDANGVSYAKWSMADKAADVGSSVLEPGASVTGGWTNAQLTAEGEWTRTRLRAENANPAPACSGGGGTPTTDDLVSATTPASVQQGQTITIPVKYSASAARDIYVVFQLDASPWTAYAERKVDVGSGSGTVNVTLTIPAGVAVAQDRYQLQTYLTTDGGAWAQRLDNINRKDVDVTAGSGGGGGTTTTSLNVYTDGFNDSWVDRSWGGSANPNDGLAKVGTKAYKYVFNGDGAVSFTNFTGKTGDGLVAIEFWARTYTGNATVNVSGSYDVNYGNRSTPRAITVTPTYQKVRITKAELGDYGWYRRFFLQQARAGVTLYVDDVKLVYAASVAARAYTAAEHAPATVTAPLVWPNPSGGALTLAVDLRADAPAARLELVDATGRVVDARAFALHAGANEVPLDYTGAVAPGVYLLRVVGADDGPALATRVVIR